MPCVGMHRQTCPGWVRKSDRPWMGTQVRRALDGYALPVSPAWVGTVTPSDAPWMGTQVRQTPGWVCTVRRALRGCAPSDGHAGQTSPGCACTASPALHGYALSVMPCMGMCHQTGPGWVHRSDMPWMGTRRQSCHALVCTVNHARHGRAPSDMPWMGTQVRHALDGYAPSVMPCMGMHRPSCPR